jgi:amino acid adenylation domain-containing protein
MERSLELIISLLAIAKAGGTSLPLDPQYPTARTATILQDSAARLVLTQQRLQPALTPIFPHPVCLETLNTNSATDVTNPDQLQAENLAYVIYTSGSTGRPKGVAITHSSAVTMLNWAMLSFTPEQYRGTLAATSICFDLSVFEIWLPLSGGGTVLLASDLLQLPSLPSARAVTLINTVPSALTELLRQGTLPETVRTVNLAGEALPASLVLRLYSLPSIQQVYNLYGPTEDTTYSTWGLAPPDPGKNVPIGKPIDQTRTYVLDERMQPVPPDIPGELYLGGAGLARGYIQQPDLTAERFVPDPLSNEPGQRLYRTGDLVVYRSNGELEFLGRKDEQVKLRGYRIEPGEIEAVLSQHPNVQQSAVVMRADRFGDQSLVAYIVPHPGQELLLSDLRTTLQQRLPLYMLPSLFVPLATLPRTVSGKIDRKALPAPDHLQLEPATQYRAPQTGLERSITTIWQEVLQREQIGIHDNFFDLGGHSLHLIRVQSTLQTTLNREIPLMALFKYPTVSALANHLSQPQEEKETPSYQSIYDRAETRRASMQRQRQRRSTRYHQSTEEEEQP